jgi:O-antigen chain-terminating methyltransferase
MFNPWFSADRFEEAFRGSRELLHDRYGDLADRFLEHGPVLDLGCGRGEFLELLVQRSIEARGVELDDALVRECRAHGLAVDRADAIGALEAAPDASLGGISLIQVVEHLSPQQTSELAPLAARVLRPGGRIVIETINPLSLFVFSHALYLDPTHVRMVHPLYLEFLFREAGFREVALEWRSVPGDDIRLPAATAEGPQSEHLNAVIERLNEVLYGPQDYALIATR